MDDKEKNFQNDLRFNGAWNSAEGVAADLWGSIHSNLLNNSVPFFAYKSLTSDSSLVQIVAVEDTEYLNAYAKIGTFSVGMITSGFSALLPHVDLSYMEGQFLDDLEKYKVDKDIIKTYKKLLEDYKNDKNNSNVNNK